MVAGCILGVLSIAAGVLALAYPDITLLVLGLVVGIYLVIIGSAWIGLATMESPDSRGGRGTALHRRLPRRSWPGWSAWSARDAGVLTLLIALSFWFIVTGVADLTRALDEGEHRVISVILGVVSIAAGVIIVANPDIGLTTLALTRRDRLHRARHRRGHGRRSTSAARP